MDQLSHQQEYKVKVVGSECKMETVSHVTAVNSASEALIERIIKTDLVTTAVGPTVLDIIAKTIAKGLSARFAAGNTQPLNIIACENMVRGTTHLKQQVYQFLTTEEQQQADVLVASWILRSIALCHRCKQLTTTHWK